LKAVLGRVFVTGPKQLADYSVMIAIDGGTLFYDVSGGGPPILFVAGLGEHGTYWMAQVAAFSSAFQVVTFDHGGVGASEGQPSYRVEQWAADILRLIDHLGLGRVHLVGHSSGGAIAQLLAADHSDRVASLVLGGTWARLDARLRQLFMFRKRALYEQVGFDQRRPSGNTPQEIAAARIDALLAYDVGERLRSIRNPTLVIAAADDLLVPWQLSELITEEIAHARLVKLDHGGHHFPQTQFEAYNALLLEFFRAHPERDNSRDGCQIQDRPQTERLNASCAVRIGGSRGRSRNA
jgi:aminoacrylate hydrolase